MMNVYLRVFVLVFLSSSASAFEPRRRRRLVHFGRMDEISKASVTADSRPLSADTRVQLVGSRQKSLAEEQDELKKTKQASKYWPPWPFNMIGRKESESNTPTSRRQKIFSFISSTCNKGLSLTFRVCSSQLTSCKFYILNWF